MNVDKFGFSIGTEDSFNFGNTDEVYDEGTEGIKKIWNRHILGSMKMNVHERNELIEKLSTYSDQARIYVKNELTSILKDPKYAGKVTVKYPFGKNSNSRDVSSSSSKGENVYRIGNIVEVGETDPSIMKSLNKTIESLINKFIKEHKPPISVSHEIRLERIHCIVPDRAILEYNQTGSKESEDNFDMIPYMTEGTEGLIENIKTGANKVSKILIQGYNAVNNKLINLGLKKANLTSEDYEFIKSKQMKKVGDQILKEFKSYNISSLEISPFKMQPKYNDTLFSSVYDFGSYSYDDFLRLFNTKPEVNAFAWPLCVIKLKSESQSNESNTDYWSRIIGFMKERSPENFNLVMIPITEEEVVVFYTSPTYKNKNTVVTPSGESYNRFDFSLALEDYKLFNQNPYGFGLESVIDYNRVLQDCKDMYASLESNMIPIDVNMDTYMAYIGGIEGLSETVGGFFTRGWAKFRRVLHPIIKSDIKVSEDEFKHLKTKFDTQIQKVMPGFETKLKENRFLAFLMENGGITINKNVTNTFNNESRMVSAILVTINSSKIQIENDSYLKINGKKKDIMDLRNDDKILSGGSIEGVIYIAINDIILAVNKIIYKEIKKEPELNKLGLAAELLNDGSYTIMKAKSSSVGYSYNNGTYGHDVYEYEDKNGISQQLQNKDLLIGLRSRPLVITSQAVAASESENEYYQNNYKGGLEMGVRNFSPQIDKMDADLKRLKESPLYNKGTESTVEGSSTLPNDDTAKEILHRVLDEYGVDGLNRILNKK